MLWGDEDSPWVATAKYVFERDGLFEWDNNSLLRLCNLLRCRVEDLCAHAGMFDREFIRECIGKNSWPPFLSVQWQRLLKFKIGVRAPDRQEALAVKMFDLTTTPDAKS